MELTKIQAWIFSVLLFLLACEIVFLGYLPLDSPSIVAFGAVIALASAIFSVLICIWKNDEIPENRIKIFE